MHKILILNDTVISKNFGCQLVSHSIRKVLPKYYPNSTIHYLDFNKDHKNINVDYDMVIVNGEGSFGHHSKFPGGFTYLKSNIDTFFKKGIPVFLVNTSIQVPLNTLATLENWLSKFKKIGLREPISYMYLFQNTKLKNIKLYPDLGTSYFTKENNQKEFDFCFGFGSVGKESKMYQKQIMSYFDSINQIVQEGYNVKFLGFPGEPLNDSDFGKKYLNQVEILETTFQNYYDEVKKAKIHITGRHHGAIMSFLGHTPFISFESNMWKTEGDQLLYGPFRHFSLKNFNEIEFIDLCKDTYNKLHTHQKILQINYNKLSPFFEGHIKCTVEDFDDIIQNGILEIQEISKFIRQFHTLDFKKYGL